MAVFYENSKRGVSSWITDEMTFSAHLHSQVEIICVIEGEVNVTINFENKTLREGDSAIIFPNIVHSYESIVKNKIRLTMFDLDVVPNYSSTLLKYTPDTPFMSESQIHKDAQNAMQTLCEEEIKDKRLSSAYANIIMGRILASIELTAADTLTSNDIMMKILNYICENYKDNISLDVLSKKVGASKYHISRIFSSRIGCSFNKYVNSLRVGLSQYLLMHSNLSITDIAYECGFESQRSFNRAFKEFTGYTPSEVKKLNISQ